MPPVPLPPMPPMPPMPHMMWPQGSSGGVNQNTAFPVPPGHVAPGMFNQGFMPPPQSFMNAMLPVPQHDPATVFTEMDQEAEETFLDVLEQIIDQLKVIMKKDLCKKMVQDTAFKTYDQWLTAAETHRQNKVRVVL